MTPYSIAGRSSLVALLSLGLIAPGADAQEFFGEDTDGDDANRSTLVASANAENLFLAHLMGVGTESFEGFDQGETAPLGLTFPGAGTATLTGGGCVSAITWSACSNPTDNSTVGGTNGFGRYPVTGEKYWEADAGAFAIDFTSPIAAFGFYGVDIGDLGGSLTLSFLNGAATVAAIDVAHETGGGTSGNAFFFGYINELSPFDRVEFGGATSGDIFAFDDMTIGAPEQVREVVPEPVTVVLLATGLLGLALVHRRRSGDLGLG